MTRSSLFKLLVAALLFVALQPSRAAAQAYDVTADIPNLSGSYYYWWYYGNYPTSISDTGKVTGWGYNSSGYQRAFLFDGTQTIDLGTLGGSYNYSTGVAVNNAGHVIGQSYNTSNVWQGFLYNGGALVPIAFVPNGWSQVRAINASGHIIGYGQTSSGSYQAFVYRGSASGAELLSGLLTVSGYYINEAIGINDAGQIVASGYSPSGQWRALLLTPSGSQYAVTEIAFSATQWSYPRAINAAGQVVGDGQTSAGYQHAFLYTPGSGTLDLGTLGGSWSEAVDVNDSGQVTGRALRSDGNWGAFLYSAGTMQDLGSNYPQAINNLGQVLSNYYLYSGGQWRHLSSLVSLCGSVDSGYTAVNNSGVLALRGYRTSEYRAFIASPVSGVATTTLHVYDSGGTYGGSAHLAARLWAACSYLAGEQIEFSILGSSTGSATTDTWGYAYIPAASLPGVEPGDYPTGVGGSFAGNAVLSAAAGTARLYVDKRYPVLSWSPESLIEGTPLGAPQLNATADVPGTFTYSPAAGTVMTAGLRSVNAFFEPSDTVHYHYQSASTVLAVRASAPAVSFGAAEIPGLGGSWLEVNALNDSGKVVGRSARSTGPEHAFMYSAGVTTDLGTLGGYYDWSMAVDVNNAGQVAGQSYNSSNRHHAFLYSGGVMTDLGTLSGSYYDTSGSVAINESGQVAGWSYNSSGYQRAFLYSGGVMTDLGTLPGAYYSYPTALNDDGAVAGHSYGGSVPQRAFLWTAGVMTDLGTLGGTYSYPTAINASGHVVGDSNTEDNVATHAFLYKDGAMIDLGTLGGTWSHASDINDAGEITGWSYTAGNAAVHGFKYSGGTMTDLGALHPYGGSEAHAINASGKVVGYTQNSDGQQVGFLYTGGAMHDLNALIDENEIGAIQYTRLLNDPGQIAGTANWNGQTRAFLLTPKTLETSSITTAPAAGPRNGTTDLTATLQSAGAALEGYRVYFKLNGVSAGSAVTNAAGVAALTGASLNGITPGDYASGVSATFAGASGLSGSSATAPLHVDKAVPTIEWATPGAILYGTALGTSQLNASASVGGTFAYSPATGAVLGAGPHTLNVTFTPTDTTTYQSATAEVTLSVLPAPLTITAHNKSKVYAQPNPALTYSAVGFVNSESVESLALAVSLSTAATSASGVGSYAITPSAPATANYTIAFVNGTLSVTPAPLTITAENKTKVYGASLPALTAAYSGLVNGDLPAGLDTQVSLDTTATAASGVGAYPITASGAADANYTIAFANGTLSVTPAPLTITAENKTKVYGPGLPALTAAYSGLVNGDLPASLDTQVSLTTTATAASVVGTYPITASGAADANYTIGFVNGTLTVTPAALTIVADDKSMLLNGTLPDLTVSYIGFTNGDTAASLAQQPTVSTTATGGTPGAFAITATGAQSPNYTIGYAPGTLSVLFSTGACLGQPGHVVLQPIDASGSVFKKGSTVPVKFRVCDAAGQSVAAGVVKSFVQFKVVAGTEVTMVTEEVISTTPDTTFRWDPTAQQWIFNLNTKNLVLNKTYYYRITLMDNSIIEFHFGVR